MNDNDRLSIERECERLVTAYCHYIDHGEASRVSELFTDDGVWSAPGVRMEGQEQLRAGFAEREANTARMSRHVCNNLLVDVIDEDHAESTVYLTLYRHDGEAGRAVSPVTGPVMVGEYQDRFVRTEDGWRIQERGLVLSFVEMEPAEE